MLRDNSQSKQPDSERIEQSRRGFKEQLAAKVSVTLAKADGYKSKNNTEKMKTCSQCGDGFHGRADQDTCGSACRMAKSRG